MSFTDRLRAPGSPIRAYLDSTSPWLAETHGGSAAARTMTRALGLEQLTRARTVVPPPPDADTARAGTAVDYRARVALGNFDVHDSVAAQGVALLPLLADEVDNGAHRVRVLAEAFRVVSQAFAAPADDTEMDRACLVLAHCEQVYRAGRSAFAGSVGAALDAADNGMMFAVQIDAPSLRDLRALMDTNAGCLDGWRDRINEGERFEPNPAFSGSALVGGADGDWLLGDTLVESKAYAKLTVANLRGFLRQLLGYVMLDLDDALGIRSVGLWLPRQALTKSWSLEHLLGGDPEQMLPELRAGFRSAASGTQLAARELATQRRKHQLLAENRHTPRRMLVELAASEDIDVRYRIGRNPVTPGEVLRRLAADRYARVRAGVARNERAPTNVLACLSRDSSVVVRRALKANPSASSDSVDLLAAIEPHHEIDAQAQRSGGLVATDGADVARSVVPERDTEALDSQWFADFLSIVRGGQSRVSGARVPVPEASERWALAEGRALDLPDWLRGGLPDKIRADLLLEHRPAWLRRSVAWDVPIGDAAVRDRLLVDPDPDIRWDVLRRTVVSPDDALTALLGRLATDRKERARFRSAGLAEIDRETLSLIASHPSTPHAALTELLASKSPEVLIGLATNPALTGPDLAELLPKVTAIRSREQRARLAASSRLSPPVALALVGDRDPDVRLALAGNAAVPLDAIETLAHDPTVAVRLAIVANPTTPAERASAIARDFLTSSVDMELLQAFRAVDRRTDLQMSARLLVDAFDRLSRSRVRDPDMRRITAQDERAGARTLARLARSADHSVRGAVARNSSTPADVLATLAADAELSVRSAAASNPALDIGLLSVLARDEEPVVRVSAAQNARMDSAALAELLHDDHHRVRSAAYNNSSTRSEDKASAEATWERAWWQAAPSRAELAERVASKRAEVRIEVAYDSRTPPDVLVLLGGEARSAKVRRAVAANPSTPVETLASLASDADAEVRQAVAFNSATPPDVLAQLAGRGIDLAIIVALNPDAPLTVLDVLAEDRDPLVSHVAMGLRAARTALLGGDKEEGARAALESAQYVIGDRDRECRSSV